MGVFLGGSRGDPVWGVGLGGAWREGFWEGGLANSLGTDKPDFGPSLN